MRTVSEYKSCVVDGQKHDLTAMAELIDNAGPVKKVIFPWSTPDVVEKAMLQWIRDKYDDPNIQLGEPKEWMEDYVCVEI